MLSTRLTCVLKDKPILKGQFNLHSKGGKDGITPHISENGNWFIGKEDTGIRAEGMSAYEVAVKNGFSGTEEEWLEFLRVSPDLTGFATESYVAQAIQEALGGIENGTY